MSSSLPCLPARRSAIRVAADMAVLRRSGIFRHFDHRASRCFTQAAGTALRPDAGFETARGGSRRFGPASWRSVRVPCYSDCFRYVTHFPGANHGFSRRGEHAAFVFDRHRYRARRFWARWPAGSTFGGRIPILSGHSRIKIQPLVWCIALFFLAISGKSCNPCMAPVMLVLGFTGAMSNIERIPIWSKSSPMRCWPGL